MSQLKKTALKMGVIGLVLWGGYTWVNHTPERAESVAVTTGQVVETTLDNTETMLDKSSETVGAMVVSVTDAVDNADIKGKIDELQDNAKPLGALIKKNVNPNNIPGVKAAGWLDGKTSFPAMLLLLVGGIVLSMLALASPASLTGGRH